MILVGQMPPRNILDCGTIYGVILGKKLNYPKNFTAAYNINGTLV